MIQEVLLSALCGLGAAVFITAKTGPGSMLGSALSRVLPSKWVSCVPCVSAWCSLLAGLLIGGPGIGIAAWLVGPALWWLRTGTGIGGCSGCGATKNDVKERKRAEHASAMAESGS
jgi:hypothetical protein